MALQEHFARRDILALASLYEKARREIQAYIERPKATNFQQVRGAELIAQINETLADLGKAQDAWATGRLPASYRVGMRLAATAIDRPLPTLSGVHRTALGAIAEAMIRETAGESLPSVARNVSEAFIRAKQEIVQHSRLLERLGVGTARGFTVRELTAAVVQTLRDGAAYRLGEAISDDLKEQLQAVAEGKWISIRGKDGKVRRYDLQKYGRLVARTATRFAHSEGVLQTSKQYGMDLVQVSVHARACPQCIPFQGKVYSISGDNPDFPALIDENRPPIHPNCAHVLLPAPESFLRSRGLYDGLSRWSRDGSPVKTLAEYQEMLQRLRGPAKPPRPPRPLKPPKPGKPEAFKPMGRRPTAAQLKAWGITPEEAAAPEWESTWQLVRDMRKWETARVPPWKVTSIGLRLGRLHRGFQYAEWLSEYGRFEGGRIVLNREFPLLPLAERRELIYRLMGDGLANAAARIGLIDELTAAGAFPGGARAGAESFQGVFSNPRAILARAYSALWTDPVSLRESFPALYDGVVKQALRMGLPVPAGLPPPAGMEMPFRSGVSGATSDMIPRIAKEWGELSSHAGEATFHFVKAIKDDSGGGSWAAWYNSGTKTIGMKPEHWERLTAFLDRDRLLNFLRTNLRAAQIAEAEVAIRGPLSGASLGQLQAVAVRYSDRMQETLIIHTHEVAHGTYAPPPSVYVDPRYSAYTHVGAWQEAATELWARASWQRTAGLLSPAYNEAVAAARGALDQNRFRLDYWAYKPQVGALKAAIRLMAPAGEQAARDLLAQIKFKVTEADRFRFLADGIARRWKIRDPDVIGELHITLTTGLGSKGDSAHAACRLVPDKLSKILRRAVAAGLAESPDIPDFPWWLVD